MILLQRFTPLITSVLIWLTSLILFLEPKWLLGLFGLNSLTTLFVALLTLLGVLVLLGGLMLISRGFHLSARLRFFPFLLLTWLSGLSVFLFSESRGFLFVLTILIASMIFLWLESLYLFWQQPESYQASTLPQLANYLYLVMLFLFVSGLTGLQILMQIPIWLTGMIVIAIVALIQYDLLQLHNVDSRKSQIFTTIGSLLFLQLFIILNLLPTHFFMYGLISALFFYVWLGIGRQALKRELEQRSQLNYIIVSSVGFVATFISSIWIQ